MAGRNVFRCIGKLFVILLSVTFHHHIILQQMMLPIQQMVTEGLEVTSLWDEDINNNITQPCYMDNTNPDRVTVSGSLQQTCSLQISAAQEHQIQIQVTNVNSENDVYYVERFTDTQDCPNRYLTIQGGSEGCSTVFQADTVQVNLQSNSSLLISEQGTGSAEECTKTSPQDCASVTSYSNQSTCTFEWSVLKNETGQCRVNFTSGCNVTISKGEAAFQCMDSDTLAKNTSMLIYPLEITELNLTSNRIINIDVNAFANLANLQGLYLYNNTLVTLQPGVFNGLTNLQWLLLNSTNMESVSEDLFKGLVNLKRLDLSRNKLSELPVRLIRDLVNLEVIILDDNLLSSLHEHFFRGLNHLQELDLSGNMFNDTLSADFFKDLENLQILRLDNNNLLTVERALFQNLNNLKVLTLNHNFFTSLPADVFQDLEKLSELSLQTNQLTALDSNVFQGLNNLTELYLNNNTIKELPVDIFQGLGNLQILYLYKNELSSLDKDIFKGLTNLTYVNLNYNFLRNLSVGIFDGLSSLETINVRTNELDYLDVDIFQGLPSLQIIRLTNNSLSELPIGLFRNLRNLITLTLRGNLLSDLDVNIFQDLESLEALFLHHNHFETLPKGIFDIHTSMKLLRLNENQFRGFDSDLFKNLKNLTFLDISANKFMDIPKTEIIPYLKTFGAAHNPLTDVTADSFTNITNGTRLLVSQHEICECYTPKDVECVAEDDRSEYLTCKRLLSDRFLVGVIWLIGLNAILGNLFVLIWKQRHVQVNRIQSILLSNLAISDLFMGIYMVIIASADIYFGEHFPMRSETWRTGGMCFKLMWTLFSFADHKMAGRDAISCIGKLFIFVLSVTFHHHVILQQMMLPVQQMVAEGLDVTSLWDEDINNNITQPCLMDNTNPDRVTVSGSLQQTCSLQVSAAQARQIQIQVTKVNSENDFFYVERFTDTLDCPNRYLTIQGGSEGCSTVFQEDTMQVNLQSNSSLLISEQGTGSSEECTKTSPQNCASVTGYNSQSTCIFEWSVMKNETGQCRVNFTSDCNVTISKGEAAFQCMDADTLATNTSLLVYPLEITELNLTSNRIVNINVNAFANLANLQGLYLYNNTLVTLQPGVFNGLTNLQWLLLNRTNMESVSEDLFKGLVNLKRLDLSRNKLSELPVRLIRDLVNLEVIILDENLLTSLHEHFFLGLNQLQELDLSGNMFNDTLSADFFKDLENLHILRLDNNNLLTIERALFQNLINLTVLTLNHNFFTSLPADVFQDLENLSELSLQTNQLTALDSNIFQGLNNLTELYLNNNTIKELPVDIFQGLDNLQILYLYKNELSSLDKDIFKGLINLTNVNLNYNFLRNLSVDIFDGLSSLEILSLRTNELDYLDVDIFQGLPSIQIIRLTNNSLSELPIGLFRNLRNLIALELRGNLLSDLDVNIFQDLESLERLFLHHNHFEKLPKGIFDIHTSMKLLRLNENKFRGFDSDLFKTLKNLTFLDISANKFMDIPKTEIIPYLETFGAAHNPLTDVTADSFANITNGTRLLVSQHEICECYAPKDVKCIAEDDRSEYLTCKRLLSDRFLVGVIWLIGLNAILGNLFVLIWKQRHVQVNRIQSILLSNLAISDLLMGIYMVIIACADIHFGDHFPMRSETWRTGGMCKFAGTVAIMSSEASVFFVTFISIDRFICIKFPDSAKKDRIRSTFVIVALMWILSFALGLVPSVLAGKNFKFYDNSYVCIGLPLSLEEIFTKHHFEPEQWEKVSFWLASSYSKSHGFAVGLYYSTALFLGLNCACFLIVLACYIEIVRIVKTSFKRAGGTYMKEEIRMTMKVTAIVATDFLCWFPIIILGILVQTRAITLPASVYAWLVTCVLPINSAVNPYLYTIAEVISKYRKQRQVSEQEPKISDTQQMDIPQINFEKMIGI
ncbi:uncharacterized protein [Amphiura filiformis]|uniref:uncharacterized protein n=1 Tax=Amphiura filiformis TaxID=82378 RepID=UPI003B211F02